MADGDCQEILSELYTYLDGELTHEVRIAIRGHLEHCPDCLEVYDFEAELRALIAKRCQERAPESLRERVARALAEEQGRPIDPTAFA